MQLFLFLALGVALLAVLFALQNIVPVTVAFLTWTFEGSLAVMLFVALIAGALASYLASVPTSWGRRRTIKQLQQRVSSLEAELAATRRDVSISPVELPPPRDEEPTTPILEPPPGPDRRS